MIPALINHLWQSTLFALGAGLLTLTLRRNGAGVRYGLWFAASVKFLLPFALLTAAGGLAERTLHLPLAAPQHLEAITPIVQPFTPAPAISLTTPTPSAIPLPARHAATVRLDPTPIMLGVWAIGLGGVLLVWARRWSRIRAALAAARPTPLPAPVPVLSTPAPMEPGVIGLWRPVLIVPDGITEQLTPAEWKAVLAHELCHMRRRDNLTGAIHMLAQALFWFYPLIWWIGARLVAEREQACDEAVARSGADAHTYAEGLLKVCRLYLRQPLVCAAGVSGADLKRRVARILDGAESVRLGLAKAMMLGAAAVLAVAVPLSVGLFAGAPLPAHAGALAQVLGAPPAPAKALAVAAAANPQPEAEERAAPYSQAEAPAPPEPAKPIVLAAIETVLSPVPEVARAETAEHPAVAELSQTAPDPPLLETASTSPPSDDWGVLGTLSGVNYSGDVFGGVGVLRLHKSANGAFTLIYGMAGEAPQTIALKLVAKNIAVRTDVEHAIPGGPLPARVYLKSDGWIIQWNRPGCAVYGRGGCFFPMLTDKSGVAVTTFTVTGGKLIANQSSNNGGRVVFKPYAGPRPAAFREPEGDPAAPAQTPSVSGGSTMNRAKFIPAVFAAAALASGASAAPTVYIPPGAEQPRFGGEFDLAEAGPVGGYWRTACYDWHLRSQARRTGPMAPPALNIAFKQFVSGLISENPNYDAMSPAMAEAVRKNIPTYWASLNHMGHATVGRKFDTTSSGDELYVLDLEGGRMHWNMTVTAEGKIASAFLCSGTGL